jgi:methylase of polypeptide subunit release factors
LRGRVAARNDLTRVEALQSNLFSVLPESRKFDVIISSPPSFSGEPRDDADRAWHAGPGYRDILPLFEQAALRLLQNGRMYLPLFRHQSRADAQPDPCGRLYPEADRQALDLGGGVLSL